MESESGRRPGWSWSDGAGRLKTGYNRFLQIIISLFRTEIISCLASWERHLWSLKFYRLGLWQKNFVKLFTMTRRAPRHREVHKGSKKDSTQVQSKDKYMKFYKLLFNVEMMAYYHPKRIYAHLFSLRSIMQHIFLPYRFHIFFLPLLLALTTEHLWRAATGSKTTPSSRNH